MPNPVWLNKYSEESKVVEAYKLAKEAHEDVDRLSGSPYITHSVEVARTVREWGLDETTIAAAFLHDVVEDTDYTLEEIEEKFGEEVKFLVDGVTKIGGLGFKGQLNPKEKQAKNFRKLLIALSKDLRVVFIKLADRLHNMRTLDPLDEETRKKKAEETYEIYAPLAYRLGMEKLAGELKDLAFPYLYPEKYEWLLNNVEQEYEKRERYAEKVEPVLEEMLEEEGIEPIKITSRAKRYSSLYKKLEKKDMDIDKIYDLVALRVIVNTVEECYKVLGRIHEDWPPVPGRIKDYIARPKPNGYRSLHTTVFCIDEEITEIQIRTEEMHKEAELGAAAHWAYQQTKKSKKYKRGEVEEASNGEMQWVRQLREWQKNFKDSEKFLESLKGEFFKDRIFVLTPKGDVIDLPSGSTPVDFAYKIHSDIGDQCSGAKVNEDIVSLDYELSSGDLVEIITQPDKNPSKEWLDFVETSTARNHIKDALRGQEL